MTITEYAKSRKISRQTLYTRIREAGKKPVDYQRDKDGNLSDEAVRQLDTLFTDDVNPVDVQLDTQLDTRIDTDLTRLTQELQDARLENAVLHARIDASEARIAALEETLAFTRAELEKAHTALSDAQTIANQAQQLHARALLPGKKEHWWNRKRRPSE